MRNRRAEWNSVFPPLRLRSPPQGNSSLRKRTRFPNCLPPSLFRISSFSLRRHRDMEVKRRSAMETHTCVPGVVIAQETAQLCPQCQYRGERTNERVRIHAFTCVDLWACLTREGPGACTHAGRKLHAVSQLSGPLEDANSWQLVSLTLTAQLHVLGRKRAGGRDERVKGAVGWVATKPVLYVRMCANLVAKSIRCVCRLGGFSIRGLEISQVRWHLTINYKPCK